MSPALSLTFLGHQGWLFQCAESCVLFDPILGDSFGHSLGTDFRVFPARTIDISRLPKIEAVFISHEHLDHFHLPSLSVLPRSTRIFLGPLMPRCVEDALTSLGFVPVRLDHFSTVVLAALEVVVFPSGDNTVVWESRVTSYLVHPRSNKDVSVFIAVDALVSTEYITSIAEGHLPNPTLVVVSNNSQIVPYGGFGSHTNVLPIPDPDFSKFTGLAVLHALLFDYLAPFPDVRNIAICGNGFINMNKPYGPFLFSNNKELASSVNPLLVKEKIFGSDPGDILCIFDDGSIKVSTCDYIRLNDAFNQSIFAKREQFSQTPLPHPITPLCADTVGLSAAEMLNIVLGELNRLCTALLVSPTGRRLIELNEYLSGSLGSRRAIFRLLHIDGDKHRTHPAAECP
jgi:hypothetical protein